eukprot:TRINITY_DN9886_c0_g2_i3.p1 TRINITY_DN9886_c0_g2~~TRINITY_DN9886_c0_g2_i3.p1  ORF type:complete len:419 (-),score=80.47 TRINITY_DN9886_c0_g2_i3:120-1376(-)
MGMRGIKCMVTETSLLDPEEGILFRGYTIPECLEKLPRIAGATQPSPEGLIWLLMTGEIPTVDQVSGLVRELNSRVIIPKHVEEVIDSFPKQMHPMSQLSAAVLALQTESVFADRYARGMPKTEYWEATYEDVLNIIANMSVIASRIYRNVYRDGKHIPNDPSLDYSSNFAKMLGHDGHKSFADFLRLYLIIQSDHEGGNVSSHATHLVGSALSDPYLACSSGLNGLAGPLHGLASQETLHFLNVLTKELGGGNGGINLPEITNEDLTKRCHEFLASGRIIPGYGNAVLRKTDPRFLAQREFALRNINPIVGFVKLVHQLYDVVPGVLLEGGKTKNPWPNAEAHSGCLLMHYGLVEENYYTVIFGVSRTMGILSSLLWDRILGFPLERPKSVTTEWISKNQSWLAPRSSQGSSTTRDE